MGRDTGNVFQVPPSETYLRVNKYKVSHIDGDCLRKMNDVSSINPSVKNEVAFYLGKPGFYHNTHFYTFSCEKYPTVSHKIAIHISLNRCN